VSSHQPRWILSGGLASGKSQVRELLERQGIHTIDADAIGHEVLSSDSPASTEVAARWPQVIEDGEVDRGALATIVFKDRDELAALEVITHPHIFGKITAMVEEVDEPVVVEIPVLRHSLGSEWRRIVVDCRFDVQLERAIARGMSVDDARARLTSQPTRVEWLAAADAVVPNHRDLGQLEEAVVRFGSSLAR
jgi:dephospho-CoA kinase